MYNLFSNEKKFTSKKVKIILLIKAVFLRFKKKVIQIICKKVKCMLFLPR